MSTLLIKNIIMNKTELLKQLKKELKEYKKEFSEFQIERGFADSIDGGIEYLEQLEVEWYAENSAWECGYIEGINWIILFIERFLK